MVNFARMEDIDIIVSLGCSSVLKKEFSDSLLGRVVAKVYKLSSLCKVPNMPLV